jgi:hypothetical protein
MENRQSTYEAFYDLYEVSVSVVEPRAALKYFIGMPWLHQGSQADFQCDLSGDCVGIQTMK